jgi:hypothetical protein
VEDEKRYTYEKGLEYDRVGIEEFWIQTELRQLQRKGIVGVFELENAPAAMDIPKRVHTTTDNTNVSNRLPGGAFKVTGHLFGATKFG